MSNNTGYWVSTEAIRAAIKQAVVNQTIDDATAEKLSEILLHDQEYIERK